MPPGRVIWAGLFTFVTTLTTAIGGLYAQLSGTATSIGKGAWIFAACGSVSAAFVAGKTAWDALREEAPKL